MSHDATRVLIAEYMPSLNKGGLELLEGIVKSLEAVGRTKVDAFSLYPALDGKRFPANTGLIDICKDLHVERSLRAVDSPSSQLFASFVAGFLHLTFVFLYKLIGRNVLSILKSPIWRKYCSSDVLIACINEDDCVNGNYLQFSPVYISLIAKTLRKPVVVYANSTTKPTNTVWIWRLQSRTLWKILAAYSLNNMDMVTTRDRETFEHYRAMIRRKIPVRFTGDVGVLLEAADTQTVNRIMAREKIEKSECLLVGAAITRRLLSRAFPECADHNERYEKSVSEIANVFDRLVTDYRARIVFIPHCIEYYVNNDDRVVARDIRDRMKNKSNAKVITNEYTPQELKGLFGQFDIFIGDRIHALISALSMNVPCCVLAYRSDRRPYNLVGEDFKQGKWIFEVDTFKTDTLYQLISDLISASGNIRRVLPAMTQRAKERAMLNGQMLKTLLDTHAARYC